MDIINWTIDQAHSEIGFRIRHMMISWVRGTFGKYQGTVVTQGNDWTTAKIHLTIDASSIDTNNAQRDTHLRSKDFFFVESYPQITYDSTKIERKDDENYLLTGNLTIHGVTESISVVVQASGVVKDPFGNFRAGFTITGSFSRKDFGLTWNGTMPGGNSIIGDIVNVNCEAEITHE